MKMEMEMECSSSRHPKKEITLRHLLRHSSGLCVEDEKLIQEWRKSRGERVEAAYHPESLKRKEPKEGDFTTPLLLESGEG
jgi:CubicO group peptidase (beta-lactamase class C family)